MIAFFLAHPQQGVTPSEAPSAPTTSDTNVVPAAPGIGQPTVPNGGTNQPAQTTGNSKSAPATRSTLNFAVPLSNDQWAIGVSHLIAWNKPAGVTGGLYLADASTKKLVGWILPNTTVRQTSYDWDTRDVSITRTGGTRQPLTPGTYVVRLMFDGKYAEIESPTFTILAEGSVDQPSAYVRIGDGTIAPRVLEVPAGRRVVFLNADTVRHTISKAGPTDFSVDSGKTYILQTSGIPAGTYPYSSNVYTYTAPGTLIIK
ncbi:MAG TPA: hypothetical protein VMT55_02780 [Candidatus Sulfotelmatobacter sp.]|nr:hypothetical protein [Candidatus Sulfotelmatobacter sp.]